MKNKFYIKWYISISVVFFYLTTSLYAGGTTLIDLSSQINITPTTKEVSQPFTTDITIKNENSGSTIVDGNGASIKYTIPNGSTYNGVYSGTGWSCDSAVDSNGDLECTYNQSLTNGQTSNTLTITLDAPSSIATGVNAEVTVTPTTTDADNSNNSASTTIEFGKSNLHIDKTVSKSTVGLNEEFTYTLTITNPYNGTNPTVSARDVNITDTLPSGVSYVSGSLSDTSWCSESSNTITCSGQNIDVSTTRTVTFKAKATTDGIKTNTANATDSSSDYNAPTSALATVSVEPADLKLTKTLLGGIDSNNAEVNSTVIYNISITNLQQTPAKDVNFTDTLPNEVVYQSLSAGSDWSCNQSGGTVTCNLTHDLNYNETYDVNISVKMPTAHQTVSNTATAYTSTTQNDTSNDSDTITTYVRGSDLKVDKTGNGVTVGVGKNYTYTVTITNKAGKAEAKDIVVTDTLDNRMTYVSDTGGCTISGHTLTCTKSSLAQNSSYSFDVTVKMPTDSLADVTNSVSVTNSVDEEDSSDNSKTVTTHLYGPDLNIQKDANVSEVGLNKPFVYTLHISSSNEINATDVNITDQLPTGATITNISAPSGWNCPSPNITGTFSCTKNTFTGKSSEDIILTAKAPNTTGDITNIVNISQSLNPNDGSSSKTVTVTGVTLNITKSASATAITGGLIDYNVTVTNTSHSDAQNLTLTDDLNSHLGNGYTVNQVIDNGGWDCSGSTGTSKLTCTLSTLASEGASSTIHFNVSVPNNAPLGTVTNQADVNTTTDPILLQSATAQTVIQGADLVVVAPTTLTAVANETSVFTVTVRNDGTATAKDVNLTNSFNINSITNGNFTNIKIDCDNDGNYDITSSPYKCDLGDINSGNQKLIKISLTAPNYDSNFPGNVNITNNSTATTSTSDSNPNNNNTNWSVNIHGADLVIYKEANQSEVAVNGKVKFDIYIKNQGEANATNIHMSDHVVETSDGFTLDTSTLVTGTGWSCSNTSSTGFDCSYSDVLTQNQESSHITIEAYAPNSTTSIDKDRSNEANTTTDTAETEIATTNDKVASVTIRGADLNITKSVSPSTTNLKGSVTYTITVTNNGLADANGTYVNDILPNGFTNISTSGCDNDGSSVSGQSVHCTLGTLPQSQTKTFTITTNAPNTNGTYTNTASTTSTTPEANTNDNNASVNLTVEGADLAVYKAAPARVAGNSTFTYTISLANIGTSTAYGAEINDTIPNNDNTTYVNGSLTTLDSDWTCDLNSGAIHCYTKDSNLSIPHGYNKNIASFKVKAGPAHYWIHNTVVTDTNTSESNYINNTYTASTEVIDVDLAARKLINGTYYGNNENYIGIDQNITYTLQVANISPVDINITDVNFTDIIPSNLTGTLSISVDSRFSCNSPSNPGDTLICTMNNGFSNPLKRSEGWVTVATISARSIDAAHFDINNENNNTIINKYKAETSLSDQNLGNNAPGGNSYLETNTLVRGANMSIVKTVSSNQVGADQPFSYILATRNYPRSTSANHDIPSTTATDIVVKDILPPDVSYTGYSGTNWSCNENSHIITCNYSGSLSPNEAAPDITINVMAPNTNGETLHNEANVTTSTPELIRLLNDNNDSIDTTTIGTDITVSKTGPEKAGMGDTVTYTITVNNISSVPASNITVVDTLPNGATYDGNISNTHWSYTQDLNATAKMFSYDQNLSGNSDTSFSFSVTLPTHTGSVRNHVEAFTDTNETFYPNKDDWDINITGAELSFDTIPLQSPNPVGAFSDHQFKISIKNSGFSPAKDINVTVYYNSSGSNPGWSDVNGSGSGWSCDPYDSANSKLICHLSTLQALTTSSILTVYSKAPNYNGDLNTTFTVVGIDDSNQSTSDNIETTTTIKGADLKIKKYAKDPSNQTDSSYHDTSLIMGINKEVDFNITVSNDSIGLAKNITVTDIFDNNLTNISIINATDWSCSVNGQVLSCSRASIQPNSTAPSIIVSAKTPNTEGTVSNSADTNTTTIESDYTNDNDGVSLTLQAAILNANFSVSKTNVALDEVYTYTLSINNSGGNEATDVNITDTLPDGFSFVDTNGSDTGWVCSSSGQIINCNYSGSIDAYNGHTVLKLDVKAPENQNGLFHNSATISSPSISSPVLTNAPDVRVIGADISIYADVKPIDVLEDRNVTYIINIKDINISTAHNINIRQYFSHSINNLYVTDDGGANCSLQNSNQEVLCTLNSLAYNEEKNITIVATMPDVNATLDPLTSFIDANTTTVEENLTDDNLTADVTVHPIMPVVNYKFEECKWDHHNYDVVDSINGINGKEYNGAKPINAVLAEDSNHFYPSWRVGKFDGNNDYVKVPNNPKLQIVKNQTICAWVKPTKFSQRRNIIAKAYGGEGTITQETDGSLSYYYGTSGENSDPYEGFSSSQSITKNKWNHICIVRNLNSMKLQWYIDGVKTNEQDANYQTATASNNDLLIGAGYVKNFKGYIDEVEIYNIALDQRAITDIYNNEKAHKNYDGTIRPQTTCAVDLRVTKTANPSPIVGAESNVTYTINVKNLSAEPLTSGFTLSDILPSGLTLQDTTYPADMSCAGSYDFNCTLLPTNIMRENDSRTIQVTATVPNTTGETLTNSVHVSTGVAGNTGQPDSDLSNNDANATIETLGTDLKITKTATLDNNGSNLIHYSINVKNISGTTVARGVIVKDTYDNRLTAITFPSANCVIPSSGKYFTCYLPDMNPGDEYNLTTTMTADDGTNITNDVNVTSHTVDINLSNNSASVSVDINTSGSTAPVKLKSDFRRHVSTNNYGNMVAIGNTILKPLNYTGNEELADINTSYIDTDNNPNTYNSSSATLNIPENNITIEYAGLYWGGHIKGKDNNDTLTGQFNSVKLTLPSGSTFTITGGDQENGSLINDDNATGFYRFKRFDNSIGRLYYAAEANVTSIIRNEYINSGSINGDYTVADINVSYGYDNTASFIPDDTSSTGWSFFNSGFFGGWELVVIYSVNHRQYRSVRYKNSTIYDGYKVLMPRSPGQRVSLDINVSGFITPSSGDIESSLYSMVLAGDKELPYEQMSIDDANGISHLVKEDGNNTNNIFNDTISLKNTNNTPITKNLDLSYNPGIDLDQFDTTNYLSNSQTSTRINLQVSESSTPTSSSSNYYQAQYAFVNMLAFNTQIFTPDFIDSYKECFKKKYPGSEANNDWVPCSEPLPAIHRGTILKYRVTIINSGTDDALNVHVTDVLPKEVDFNGTCISGTTDVNATYIFPLPDGVQDFSNPLDLDNDYNSSLRTISGYCMDPRYDYNQTVRDECVADIKAILVDGNTTTPLNTIPDGNGESLSLLDNNYTGTDCSVDSNGTTTLVFNYPAFPKSHVTWVDFYTTINEKAELGKSFQNAVAIDFTNQTLFDAGINNLQTQETEPVSSGTVTFNWTHIVGVARDPGRTSVGTKIVNKPFDLNITLSGIDTLDVDTGGNTTMTLSNLRLIDAYNGSTTNINNTIINPVSTVDNTVISWSTHNTNYTKASKEIGFSFDLTLSYKDYNETKHYPADFNSSAPYAGDVFTTRPKSFTLSLAGGSTISGYKVIKAAQSSTMNVSAEDNSGNNSDKYNNTLSKSNGINITLDSNFSTNSACINISDLNISNLSFSNGSASASNTKYNEVGVIKFDLTDSNWTVKDQTNGDCIANSGTNTPNASGLIGCNVEGNSTSIVYIPDHFDFNNTTVNDFDNNFTYMITNPITDQVYGKLSTIVTSKNMDNNITKFFSSSCFADKVNVGVAYNIDSLSLSDLNLSVANESNLSAISSFNALSANDNNFTTDESNSSFTNGIAPLNIRVYIDRNKTTPLNPALVDMRDINGSINNYLGIAGVNVAPQTQNISATNDMHFIYGRVHAPDYSTDNDVINAKIYYEGYCKDCNKTKFTSLGGESPDSIYWYQNAQTNLQDGNISGFVQPLNTKITINPGLSTSISSGEESHTITYTGTTYPYRERVDMNVSSWLLYNPFDENASVSSFFVNFSKYNDWAGVGNTGKTVDLNISSKSSKRIEW